MMLARALKLLGEIVTLFILSKDEPEAWPVLKKKEVAHNLVKKIIDQIGVV